MRGKLTSIIVLGMTASIVAISCSTKQRLDRATAAKMIQEAMLKQPATMWVQTIHRHYATGGPVDKEQWSDFLGAIRDAGFETRVIDDVRDEFVLDDKWAIEVILPETVRPLVIRSEVNKEKGLGLAATPTFGGWAVVRIGEDVAVEVTGIRRQSEDATNAIVEFQYHWRLNKQAEAFLKQLDALEKSVAPFWEEKYFLKRGLPDLEGHSQAVFILYDDG